MRKIILLLFVTGLTACGQPEPSETVESLAANPERLKELRQQCRLIVPSWAMRCATVWKLTEIQEDAEQTVKLFRKLKIPKFERKIDSMCIRHPKEYGMLSGDVYSESNTFCSRRNIMIM